MRADMLRQARAEVEATIAAKFIALSALRQREIGQSRDDIVQLARLLAGKMLKTNYGPIPSD